MHVAASSRLVWVSAVLIALSIGQHVDSLAPRFAKKPALLARRVGKFTSLTGAWSGEYQYPYPMHGVSRVPFNARIEEAGDSFTGDTDEPNTFADAAAPRLFATLAGSRRGTHVEFTKTLDGTGGASHAILYAGSVDPDFSRIEGRWSIPGDWSGTFFMERAGLGAFDAVSRAATASG